MDIKVIAFDADDTLWVNEPYFRQTEEQFCTLLASYASQHELERELLKIEIANLGLYGYGIKGFILSMIEAAMKITQNTLSIEAVARIMDLGKQMLNQPIELLDGVEEVLETLKSKYRLVVATKGDLLDQERKLKKSGLNPYFHHIEIMSEKDDANYLKLIKHLDIQPQELLMVGNSLKSDVMPVLNIGGHAVHVPYHITWAHEQIEDSIDNERFKSADSIKDILAYL
ncbi:HAD family hydrolase [Mucilaginibacter phyllosphaerae]|uniref:HAD family hydrolase n=1 Tax=Mucilaginibacter phyllosphaerae TaxID=1812349 RepID=A0A4Y8A6N9_9SPHI|nr:HAD family hydrolase [Mucilaginibacter phyllosphaerae]MBB3970979.1 putative hydrolase of the HAD superfamily [Mucilaginibacter phyllosphaerae]TEW64089.1 HAD family hydrolase [Mucilaginibacter phyllosphaerae]GGH05849.1 haloacid dehalogenase [Mucilaginibacter phyllosphaerae]